jgi:hypothetical protein
MEKLIAMVVPILPGKTEQWKEFAHELNENRHDDFVASRKRLDVHERAFLQHTPMGDMVIVTLAGPDPENAFKNFASGNDPFTNWFVKEVKEIHGFDLKNQPEGPLPELIIDSMAPAFHSN